MILALLLACSTHVTAQSTSATDAVRIVRGPMPMEGRPDEGVTVAHGEGIATGRTTYVVGRRFWAVSSADDGSESVVRIRGQAKPGPIVACTVGVLLAWPAAVGCLYVSGPTSHTVAVPGGGQ